MNKGRLEEAVETWELGLRMWNVRFVSLNVVQTHFFPLSSLLISVLQERPILGNDPYVLALNAGVGNRNLGAPCVFDFYVFVDWFEGVFRPRFYYHKTNNHHYKAGSSARKSISANALAGTRAASQSCRLLAVSYFARDGV